MADLQEMGQKAAAVKFVLQKMNTEDKNRGLLAAAERLVERAGVILSANEEDMKAARNHGMNQGLQDRLKLTADRIGDMAEGLRQIEIGRAHV